MLSYPLGEPTGEHTPLQLVERCLTRTLVTAVRDIMDVSDAPQSARRAFLDAIAQHRVYDLRQANDFIEVIGGLRGRNSSATEAMIVGGEQFVALLKLLGIHDTLVNTLTDLVLTPATLENHLILDDELLEAFCPRGTWASDYGKILKATNWILFYLSLSHFLSFADIAHFVNFTVEPTDGEGAAS